MAAIPKAFPFMTGRVGNLVFKTRLGKQYVCSLPEHYTTSYSEPAVKGRNNFAFFSRLSNIISHNFVLNSFWRSIRIPGLTTQNIIYKMLHKQVIDYDLSGISLAPCESPFNVSLKEVSLQGTTLNVSFNPLGPNQNIGTLTTPVICAQGFVFVYDPKKEKKDQFTFLPLNSTDQKISLTDDLCFEFNFSKSQLTEINSSPERRLVLNIAVKDLDGKPVRCSNTICFDLITEALEDQVSHENESISAVEGTSSVESTDAMEGTSAVDDACTVKTEVIISSTDVNVNETKFGSSYATEKSDNNISTPPLLLKDSNDFSKSSYRKASQEVFSGAKYILTPPC